METWTAEEALQNLPKLLASERPVRITALEGECAAVLLPEETYHNLIVTLELLSTPGLLNGFKMSGSDCLLKEEEYS